MTSRRRRVYGTRFFAALYYSKDEDEIRLTLNYFLWREWICPQ